MKTAVQIFGYHHAEHNLEAVFLSFASLETTSFSIKAKFRSSSSNCSKWLNFKNCFAWSNCTGQDVNGHNNWVMKFPKDQLEQSNCNFAKLRARS